MKKFVLFLILILSFSLSVSADDTAENSIQPRESSVFNSVGSSIAKYAYGGDCSLVDDGKGTMTIILQKKLTSNNSWMPVDGEKYSKSFSGTSLCSFSHSKILSSGTYRCKTIVTATVGSKSDSRTVYSPSLTLN